MKILSNSEFEKLVADQSPRIKAWAKARMDSDSEGEVSSSDLDMITRICAHSGDHRQVKWLKTLKSMVVNGSLDKIRNDNGTWEVHAAKVNALYRKGEIAFDLFDHIMVSDSGKRGTVVDYLPEQKVFVVALNPFELRQYEKKELEKIAKKAQNTNESDEDAAEFINSGEPVVISEHVSNKGQGLSYPDFTGVAIEDFIIGGWDVVDIEPDDESLADEDGIVSVYAFSVSKLGKGYDPIGGGGGHGRSDLPYGQGGGGD